MQQFLAFQFDDAAEVFSSPASSSSILACANAAASFLALGSNRRCIKECSRGLDLCSSKPSETLHALTAPKLLLYRGAAHALLGSASSSLAADDWRQGLSLMLSGDVCPILGDALLARLLSSLSASSEPQRAAEDFVKMLAQPIALSTPPKTAAVAAASSALPSAVATAPPPPPPTPVRKASDASKVSSPLPQPPVSHVSTLDYSSLSSISSSSFPKITSSPAHDKALALGYHQVNSGAVVAASRTFDIILEEDAHCAPAYVGRGSVKAQSSDLSGAVLDFTAALKNHSPSQPPPYDTYKRRGQVLAALGRLKAAEADLTTAAELMEASDTSRRASYPTDPDIYNQLGSCLFKSRCFQKAIDVGFSKCLSAVANRRRDPTDPTFSSVIGGGGLPALHNMLGLAHSNVGDFQLGKESFEKALSIDGNFKEAASNLAQLHKDYGDSSSALRVFEKALAIDPNYKHGLLLRGLCHFATGDLELALNDFSVGISASQSASSRYSPSETTPNDYLPLLHMHGMVNQSLGSYRSAVASYDAVILQDAKDNYNSSPGADAINSWFNKEIALYFWSKLDEGITAFDLDKDVSPLVKEGWCKRSDFRPLKSRGDTSRLLSTATKIKTVDEGKFEGVSSASLARLVSLALKIGSFMQLKSPGFVTNRRQHRQFGLAVLETSKSIKRAFGVGGGGALTWRECFATVVKWRQLSEPNDPVFWIDQLPRSSFEEGFGLQTPLVSGEFKVFRYYPYFSRGLELTKKLMVEQCSLNAAQAKTVRKATSLSQLWDLVGGDFWVVVPCRGEKSKKDMEGTRFTLQKCSPDITLENTSSKNGFEFTIRTPGTPARWAAFSAELDECWDELRVAFMRGDDLIQVALKIFYYWVCFAPLTRGSAACGYAMLVSIVRAGGWSLEGGMLEGMQLDWEAILRSDANEFVEVVTGLLRQKLVRGGAEDVEAVECDEIELPTLRSRIEALNCAL